MLIGTHQISLGDLVVSLLNPETRLSTFVVADPFHHMHQAIIPDNHLAFLIRLRLMQGFKHEGVLIADAAAVLSATIIAGGYAELAETDELSQAMTGIAPGIDADFYIRLTNSKIENLAMAIHQASYVVYIEMQMLNDPIDVGTLKEELLASIRIER